MPVNSPNGLSGQLHELSVVAVAQAIKDGTLTSVAYATELLRRHRDLAHLNAFITVDGDAILDASETADAALSLSARISNVLGSLPPPRL